MNVLDLFSGIGGFSLGLERAGFKTVAFCEVDKKCQAVLKKHWPDVPVFDDVSNLKGKDIEETIDVICGGFPCQDISLAGKGAGLAGKRSGLWSEFHRLIKEIRPKYAIIENVSALRSRGLDQVLRALSEIGYDAEWHCITAASVGAPHRRDRIWIVAYSSNKGIDRRQWEQTDDASKSEFRGADSGRSISNVEFETMAHADDIRSQRCGNAGIRENLGKAWSQFTGGCSIGYSWEMADTDDKGLQGDVGEREAGTQGESERHTSERGWWATEPDVGRVANGISGRVDRLKQLGNAVVPQIPQLIGMAIKETEK
jgi:DNA (cytosine-5)-methyltransferase 1